MIFKIIEVNMKKKMLLISSLMLLNNAFGNSPTAESLRERDKVRDFLGSKDSARIDCKKETDKKPAVVKNKCVEYFCE